MLIVLLVFGVLLVEGCASETSAQKNEQSAVIRVSGTEGVVYSGVYGTIGGEEHSANDTIGIGDKTSKDYELAVPPDSHIFGSFWKTQGSGGTLKAEILVNDDVVAEGKTSEDWGAVEIVWPPQDEQSTGTNK